MASRQRVARITHIITGLNVGGAEMMLYNLLAHTDRSRFAPEVISLLEPGSCEKSFEGKPSTTKPRDQCPHPKNAMRTAAAVMFTHPGHALNSTNTGFRTGTPMSARGLGRRTHLEPERCPYGWISGRSTLAGTLVTGANVCDH